MTPTTNDVEPMKSATEFLRRLLNERGVEWGNIRNDGSESDYLTEWQFENNQGKAIAIEWAVGSGLSVEIHRYHLNPEQAIAATLGSVSEKDSEKDSDGRRECSVVEDEFGHLTCSECGATQPEDYTVYYCWCCGCKVKED